MSSSSQSSNVKKVSLQLAKEYWGPFVISAAWTTYSTYSDAQNIISATNIVKTFGPTFFFVSWFFGQVFRVRKQVATETSFSTIEGRLHGVVSSIENQANRMIAHVTGGDSFAYIMLGDINDQNNTADLLIIHQGSHNLYDISVRIVDVEKFDEGLKQDINVAMAISQYYYHVNSLHPGHCTVIGKVKLSDTGKQDFNVFFLARNGPVMQQIKMMRFNGGWQQAIRVSGKTGENTAGVLHEFIAPDFPRTASGIAW